MVQKRSLGSDLLELSWKEATSIYASGQSDDQLMDKAQKIYDQYKDGPFTLKHCWMILRDELKWQAILEETMMPDDVKAEHVMFLKCIRESIFGKTIEEQVPDSQED